MDIWITLGHIVILLASSLLFGGLFSRLGQSPLVGYLFAGMLLGGPGSVHLIQLALGHSDIRTTQEYLMSDQEAVIEAMKEW